MRGMAAEMQHNVHKNYVVLGTVKLGTDLEVMLQSNMKDCKDLTKIF
jgi:hypothetical protein